MVRDHGHFTGKYRGAPHYICNLQFKKPNKDVIFDSFINKGKEKYINYLDTNNLYGWAMCKPLPVSGFKWMSDFDNWKIIPCILEVDLEYPKELHDLHNDYPLAPERLMINK
ncbi:unnamed protein product, partial [Pocillopora meandrina]